MSLAFALKGIIVFLVAILLGINDKNYNKEAEEF